MCVFVMNVLCNDTYSEKCKIKKSVNVTLIVFIMKWNIVFHFIFLHYLSEPTKLASSHTKGLQTRVILLMGTSGMKVVFMHTSDYTKCRLAVP